MTAQAPILQLDRLDLPKKTSESTVIVFDQGKTFNLSQPFLPIKNIIMIKTCCMNHFRYNCDFALFCDNIRIFSHTTVCVKGVAYGHCNDWTYCFSLPIEVVSEI